MKDNPTLKDELKRLSDEKLHELTQAWEAAIRERKAGIGDYQLYLLLQSERSCRSQGLERREALTPLGTLG